MGVLTEHLFGMPRCEFCGALETVSHVLSECRYLLFAADTILKAFAPVRDEWGKGVALALLHVIGTHPQVFLFTTQGLAFWAAVRASWVLRCEVVFQGVVHTFQESVMGWVVVVLEMWISAVKTSLFREEGGVCMIIWSTFCKVKPCFWRVCSHCGGWQCKRKVSLF